MRVGWIGHDEEEGTVRLDAERHGEQLERHVDGHELARTIAAAQALERDERHEQPLGEERRDAPLISAGRDGALDHVRVGRLRHLERPDRERAIDDAATQR